MRSDLLNYQSTLALIKFDTKITATRNEVVISFDKLHSQYLPSKFTQKKNPAYPATQTESISGKLQCNKRIYHTVIY